MMRRRLEILAAPCAAVLGMLLAAAAGAQQPLGTNFTFQGRLESGGQPANGSFDVVANLYDNPTPAPASLLGTVTRCATTVTNGLVLLELDFGEAFAGEASWLQLGIAPAGACDGSTVYEYPSPLLPVGSAPNALFARQAGDAATLEDRSSSEFLLRAGGTVSGPLTLSGNLCLGGVCRNSWQWAQGAGGVLSYQGGSVGIGTASPAEALDVVGDIRASGEICSAAGCVGTSGGDGHSLDAVDGNPVDAVFVDAVGNVGVGTLTPTQKLTVAGNITSTGTICGAGGCAGSADWLAITNKPATFPPSSVRGGDFIVTGRFDVQGNSNLFGELRVGVSTEPPTAKFYLGDSISMETFRGDRGWIHIREFNEGISQNAVRLEGLSGGQLTLFDGEPTQVPNTINQTVFLDGRAGMNGGKIIVRDGLRSDNVIEISGLDEASPVGVASIRVRGSVHVLPDSSAGGYIETEQLILSGYLQLDVVTGAPPSADCNATIERGRAKFDPSTGRLYLCADTGWIFK